MTLDLARAVPNHEQNKHFFFFNDKPLRIMSLFPNREWHFMKNKLKRLPTTIFLPKKRRRMPSGNPNPAPTHNSRGQADGETQRQHAEAKLRDRGENGDRDEEYDGGGTAGEADHDDKIFLHLDHRQNAKPQIGSGNEYQQRSAAAALAAVAAAFAPQSHAQAATATAAASVAAPDGSSGTNNYDDNPSVGFVSSGNPAAAIAAAAIREGVPAHIVHRLMISTGAAAAMSGQQPPPDYAATTAGVAISAPFTQEPKNTSDGGSDTSRVGVEGAREGQGNRKPPTRGSAGAGAGTGGSSLVFEGGDRRRGPGGEDDGGRYHYGGGSASMNFYSAKKNSLAPPWGDTGRFEYPRGGAAVASGGRATASPEVWRPWQPGDCSASPSPPPPPPPSPRWAAGHDGNRDHGGGRYDLKERPRAPTGVVGSERTGRWEGGGEWERQRREPEHEEVGRRLHAPSRDGDVFRGSDGSSRERSRSEEKRRRQRRCRSDSRGGDGFKRRDDSRERDNSRGWGYHSRDEARSSLSSHKEKLSPFSRALALSSDNTHPSDALGGGIGGGGGRHTGDELTGKGGATDAPYNSGDRGARRGSDDLWDDRDDASTGRPDDDDDKCSRSANGEGLKVREILCGSGDHRCSGGGDGSGTTVNGGIDLRRDSYDPDQYDPNAYDPGEVTVKRESSFVEPRDSRRSASAESLTEARGNNPPSWSPSSSRSLSRGYQDGEQEQRGDEVAGSLRYDKHYNSSSGVVSSGSQNDGQRTATHFAAPTPAPSSTPESAPSGLLSAPLPGAPLLGAEIGPGGATGQDGYPPWGVQEGDGGDGGGGGFGAAGVSRVLEQGEHGWQQPQPQPVLVTTLSLPQNHAKQWGNDQPMPPQQQIQPQQQPIQEIPPHQQVQQQQQPQQQQIQEIPPHQQVQQQQQHQDEAVYLPHHEELEGNYPSKAAVSSVWISGGGGGRRSG